MEPIKGTITIVSEIDGEALFEVGLSPHEMYNDANLSLKVSFCLPLYDCVKNYKGDDLLTDLTTNLAFHLTTLLLE